MSIKILMNLTVVAGVTAYAGLGFTDLPFSASVISR